MNELGINCVRVVKTLHVLCVVKRLARSKSLLVVNMAVVFTHILHDGNLGVHFSFCQLTFSKKSPNSGRVFVQVVVLYVSYTVYVVGRWSVEVVVETKCATT